MQTQAAAMKTLVAGPGLHVMPGAGDGLGASLVAEAGFRLGFASGSTISALRLAQPDMDILAFPEMREGIETCIAAAPGVLWLADGDTGYGNAINVQRTIREMIVGSIDIVIQASRLRDGTRKIVSITEVMGLEGDVIVTQDLMRYEIDGEDKDGKLKGTHRGTGIGRPRFWERAKYFNMEGDLARALDALEEGGK